MKGLLPTIKEAILGTKIEEATQTAQIYDTLDYSTQGSTEVSFADAKKYYSWVPQIQSSVDNFHEMIVGSKITINADDDDAKKICEDFSNNVDLYGKMRPTVKTMLVCGVSLVEKVGNGKTIENIEEIDIEAVYDKRRDVYGNILEYVLHSDRQQDIKIAPKKVIEFGFNQFSREKWARSVFHSLAVRRTIGTRSSRPMAENIILQDDAVVAIQQNLGFPEKWYIYRGGDKDKLEKEGRKIKERKPGDVVVASEPPETLDIPTPDIGRPEPLIKHINDTIMLGGPFPTELLSGDFTSRASSSVTLQVIRQRVKAHQEYICNKLKKELFEIILFAHESGKWNTPEKIQKANLQIAFEANIPSELTPEQVKAYIDNSTITRDEAREYLKKQTGIDLFDDDVITQQQELFMQQKKAQIDSTKTDDASDEKRNDDLKKMKESVQIVCSMCKEHQHALCTKRRCQCKHG